MEYGRAPTEFFRVQDNCSATIFSHKMGFLAGNRTLALGHFVAIEHDACYERSTSGAKDELRETARESLRVYLGDHLDWNCKDKHGHPKASPFISVYSDFQTAEANALARLEQGKHNVCIAHIDITKAYAERVEYRNVRILARKLGLWIEDEAWRNSKTEYIFVNRIPATAIIGTWEF